LIFKEEEKVVSSRSGIIGSRLDLHDQSTTYNAPSTVARRAVGAHALYLSPRATVSSTRVSKSNPSGSSENLHIPSEHHFPKHPNSHAVYTAPFRLDTPPTSLAAAPCCHPAYAPAQLQCTGMGSALSQARSTPAAQTDNTDFRTGSDL